ncbi:carotenoid 1,2-hydratase [Shewanella sp. AS1]|uniref:lipocalin-like domain-containing protein n=1 Tax=Shewanella sp. AS1 TaxID=2907626 RepID=UPI001F2AE73B|nr:lipocalin-like domain-containing protein [Shewanella sp. AS1]MCE9679297.1 carotenoid 1,2-hydratase [Shewanella sp. AS1]
MKYIRVLLIACLLLSSSACEQNQESRANSMGTILGEDAQAFDKVVAGKKFTFPADHLAHPAFRQEWWYLTANLTTASGEPIGIQWTQFRVALASEPPHSLSPWASNQLYMAHAALTSVDQHLATERWSRGRAALTGAFPSPITLALENWRWQSEGNRLFPAELKVEQGQLKEQAAGEHILEYRAPEYQLSLTSTAPFQLQGDKGYSIKTPDGSVASYYYSQPFIQVSGEVKLNDQWVQVTGDAWLDREWSSQFLNRNQQGWDWFSLRLDDGSALMLFQLRPANKGGAPFYSARRMFADGQGETIASERITMQATKWHSLNGKSYPIGWQIKIAKADETNQGIDLHISPLNPNALMPLSISYWEGPIKISGSHTGVGYMELTGY